MNVTCHDIMVNIERPDQGIRDLKKAGFDCLAIGVGVWRPDFYGWNKKKPMKQRRRDLLSVSERYSEVLSYFRKMGYGFRWYTFPAME